MITQNVTLSNQEGKIQKTEQNFDHGLALLGLSGTGPWLRHYLSYFENDQLKVGILRRGRHRGNANNLSTLYEKGDLKFCFELFLFLGLGGA